jgi:hypothetical protein
MLKHKDSEQSPHGWSIENEVRECKKMIAIANGSGDNAFARFLERYYNDDEMLVSFNPDLGNRVFDSYKPHSFFDRMYEALNKFAHQVFGMKKSCDLVFFDSMGQTIIKCIEDVSPHIAQTLLQDGRVPATMLKNKAGVDWFQAESERVELVEQVSTTVSTSTTPSVRRKLNEEKILQAFTPRSDCNIKDLSNGDGEDQGEYILTTQDRIFLHIKQTLKDRNASRESQRGG